jgi:hypothetical protein
VLDDPEERPHRRRIGVDQADAVEIEVHGAGDGAARELLGRPEVDDERRGGAGRPGPRRQPLVQRGRRDEQLRVGVTVGRHDAA